MDFQGMKAARRIAADFHMPGGNVNRMFCAYQALDETIRSLFGPVACQYLAAPSTRELSANFDPAAKACRLFIDDGSGPMRALDAALAPSAIVSATRMLATLDGQSLQPSAPFLNRVLANGFRYHAAFGQVTDGPGFSIRAHARMLRPLSDFMTEEQAAVMEEAILTARPRSLPAARAAAKRLW
jgi:hypothetical protein